MSGDTPDAGGPAAANARGEGAPPPIETSSTRPGHTPPPPAGAPPVPDHVPSDDDARRWREFRPDDRPPIDPRQSGEMPFLTHLEELRGVIMRSVLAIAVGAIAGWWLAPIVLRDAIQRTVKHVVVMSPFEAFNERLKLMAVLGGVIALPVVLWQIWSFVVPGLMRRERSWVLPLVVGSVILFVAGASAAYFYVVPLVIRVLEGFVVPGMLTQIRLSFLLEFTYNLALACGILAQLPLVTMLLTAVGVVTPGFLLRQWRAALVGVFLLTALITPGDVVSAQLLMGVPMVLLYFVSVALSALVAKKRRESEAAWLADDPKEHSRAKS